MRRMLWGFGFVIACLWTALFALLTVGGVLFGDMPGTALIAAMAVFGAVFVYLYWRER